MEDGLVMMPATAKQPGDFGRDDYDRLIPDMRKELGVLQRAVHKSSIPVMIVFEGLEASGKTEMAKELLKAMDPRCFRLHAIVEPTAEESRRPFMWRFWKKIPPGGRIDIYDRSWYSRLLAEKAQAGNEKLPLSSRKEQETLQEIADFEKQLSIDRGSEQAKPYLIVKFFLSIDKKEQKRRLAKLENVSVSELLFDHPDWKAYKHYEEDSRRYDRIIELTNADYARWHVVDADDRGQVTGEVYETLLAALRKRLDEDEHGKGAGKAKPVVRPGEEANGHVLSSIDLSLKLAEDEYRKRLKADQQELARLQYKAYRKNLPVVIVFEGMDASGKGGSIKRLSDSMDPRGYEVIPIGIPDEWEKAHHYFWRFWTHFPSKGYISIFDRSWYGRVLVERVEKLTPEEDWRRAYDEINRTEEALYDNGTAIVKFWLHVSPEVEYERFMARENDPSKNWKIDPNDWKDRSNWDDYMAAAKEMIGRTNTAYAPWKIVPSDDKYFSRVTVLDAVIDTIKKAL